MMIIAVCNYLSCYERQGYEPFYVHYGSNER